MVAGDLKRHGIEPKRLLGIQGLLGLLLLLWSASAAAAEPLSPPADVLQAWRARLDLDPAAPQHAGAPDSLVARALDRNREIQAQVARYRAALAAVPQAQALPDPRLTLTEQVRSVETRVGPQRRALSLTQSFPWFGTLGRAGQVQRARADAVRRDVDQAVLDVVLGVRRDHAELAYLAREQAVTRSHIALLTRWEKAAAAGYATGRVSYADLIKVQVELGLLNDRLAGLVDRRRPLQAALNAWSDDPADRVVSASLDSTLPDLDLGIAAAAGTMREGNPALGRWEAMADSYAAGVRLARARGLPNLTLGLNYIQVDPAAMPDVADSGRDAVSVSLGLSLPIWRGGHDAAVEAAAAGLAAAEASRVQTANDLTVRLERALFGARDARRRYELSRTTLIPKARQALAAARAAYESGAGGLLDLIDGERVLLEFRISGARALADYWIALATIEHLTATPPTALAGGDADTIGRP